jgi:hypothetical protein
MSIHFEYRLQRDQFFINYLEFVDDVALQLRIAQMDHYQFFTYLAACGLKLKKCSKRRSK